MLRDFVINNITLVSIIIFLCLYLLILYFKPKLLFNNDNSLRNFGLGYKKKTIVPAWLLAIILSIISYFFVLYYLALPKLHN
jgi:hypothetical protein